eukprot:scaffold166732_cov36-Cyclotella_meneghiniana.AAC.1
MGEEQERKIDPKGGRRFYRKKAAAATPKKEKYKAPTPGLEHLVFTIGTAEDATNFTKVKDGLAEYVGGSGRYKYRTEFAVNAVNDLVEPTFVEPADPPARAANPTIADEKARMRWDEEFKQYLADERAWKDIKTASTYEAVKRDNDIVRLLELIRGYAHDHDEVKQGTMAFVEHDLRLYLTYQKPTFRARKDVVNTFGGRAGYHPALYRKYLDEVATAAGKQVSALTQDEKQRAMDLSCEDYLACLLIRISNEEMYGSVKKGLDNMNLFQQDTYPKNIEEAHRYLQNYKPESRGGKFNRGGNNNSLSQQGVAFPEPSRKEWDCHGCGANDHMVRDCTKISKDEKKKILEAMRTGTFKKGQVHSEVNTEQADGVDECLEGVANVSVTFEEASIESAEGAGDFDVFDGVGLLVPSDTGPSSKRVTCGDHKLFLDSCATNHTMCTEKCLSRLHLTKVYLRQNCNAGSKLTNRQGYWNDLPFWVNNSGIANLLSLPKLEKSGWQIQYKTGGEWQALSPGGQMLTFKKDSGLCNGMPYLDLSRPEEYITDVPEDLT